MIMKNCYVSTFISGLSSVIEREIKKEINDVEIIKIYDGLIIYKTLEYAKVFTLKFFNNSFLLLGLKKSNLNCSFNNEMNSLIQRLNINFNIVCEHIKGLRKRSFKIMAIDKNQPISINYSIIDDLEKLVSKKIDIHINKRNPDLEFIFLRRSEGIMLFMLKLTYNRNTEKKLQKGELRPELAYILISLANLNKDKIVMDPFCGHGAIPKQIVKNFKYNMCFASDNNEVLIKKLKSEYKNNNKKLFIKQRDAINLSYFEDKFIDAIITDPPWNIFEKQASDFSLFYKDMLIEFNRILKDNGSLVILMGNISDFEKALEYTKLFEINNKFHILVNGKKANIYVLNKLK